MCARNKSRASHMWPNLLKNRVLVLILPILGGRDWDSKHRPADGTQDSSSWLDCKAWVSVTKGLASNLIVFPTPEDSSWEDQASVWENWFPTLPPPYPPTHPRHPAMLSFCCAVLARTSGVMAWAECLATVDSTGFGNLLFCPPGYLFCI